MPSKAKVEQDERHGGDNRLTALAASLPQSVPFVSPDAQERALGRPFLARIGANESVFGPSPRAVEAMAAAARDVWKYGDSEAFDLRHALSQHHGIPAENLVVGEGIDGLLGYLVRLTVAPGDAVVTSDGAYPTFNFHVTGFGGVLHTVPFRDDREDLPALLDRAADVGAKLIYFSNPDNPMGSWHDARAVADAISRVPKGTLLILDEAYADFAEDAVSPQIDPHETAVIRMRTFSKAYGLAGLRVGYAISDAAFIAAFDKVRNHFGVGRLAQAGALAALQDQQWLRRVVDETRRARHRIAAIARDAGLAPLPSYTNFVTVDCGEAVELARALVEALAVRGVFVRMPFAAPGNRCIRIGCGTAADLALLEEALAPALDAARRQVGRSREQKEVSRR